MMGGGHDQPTSPEARLLGGPVQENKQKAARANPITYITKDDPPFLILHGDKDATVPFNQSEAALRGARESRRRRDVPARQRHGHGGREFSSDENRRLVEAFFDKHLKTRSDNKPAR